MIIQQKINLNGQILISIFFELLDEIKIHLHRHVTKSLAHLLESDVHIVITKGLLTATHPLEENFFHYVATF